MIKRVLILVISCLFILYIPIINIKTIAQQKSESSFNINEEFDPFMKSTLLSGQTTDVPWVYDQDFLTAIEKNACPYLMAAYKTVLKDPLPGEEDNVHLAAEYICGAVLAPNEVFSQNQKAGPYESNRGYKEGPVYFGSEVSTTIGGGVCKISSTLFNVAILSDMTIIERYTHSMPVPYVPYGQDATVFYGAKDLKFKNSTNSSVLIWAQGVDNVLYIGFYSQTIPPKIEWNHEVIKVYKANIIYKKNKNLPPNTENMLHEGMDGAIINSTLTITYSDGTVKVKKLGKSYYSPLPYIIEKSVE